jgi:indolepyruvate ferredoxin oxidoreductase
MDPKRGDRVAYRHFTRPHLRVAGLDLTFNLKTRPWMLKMMRRMKVLRTLLPSWHAEEKAFRDWYVNLVDQFEFEDEERYRAYVRALRLPEEVRGYREVIWPKMEAAYRMAEYLLNGEGEPSAIDAYLDIEPVREPA